MEVACPTTKVDTSWFRSAIEPCYPGSLMVTRDEFEFLRHAFCRLQPSQQTNSQTTPHTDIPMDQGHLFGNRGRQHCPPIFNDLEHGSATTKLDQGADNHLGFPGWMALKNAQRPRSLPFNQISLYRPPEIYEPTVLGDSLITVVREFANWFRVSHHSALSIKLYWLRWQLSVCLMAYI